ncbi:hypothetical protein ACFPRL_02350 [Pseudoclavibacter helvolus]
MRTLLERLEENLETRQLALQEDGLLEEPVAERAEHCKEDEHEAHPDQNPTPPRHSDLNDTWSQVNHQATVLALLSGSVVPVLTECRFSPVRDRTSRGFW